MDLISDTAPVDLDDDYDEVKPKPVRDKHSEESHAPAEAMVCIDNLRNLPLDDAVREKLKNSKELNVLVTGCYGVGKSTLINSLKADEGSLGPCATTKVNQYVLEMEGVTFNFYDSPGLQGRHSDLFHLNKIQTTCPNIHLFIYCSKLDEPVRPAESDALDNITKTFGMSIWDNAIVALTFANTVDSPYPNIDAVEFFKERMEDKQRKLQEAFKKLCIKPQAVKNLEARAYPAGSAKVLQLPGREVDWRAEFWSGCTEACREEGKGAALKMAWDNPSFVMKVVGASLSTSLSIATEYRGAVAIIKREKSQV